MHVAERDLLEVRAIVHYLDAGPHVMAPVDYAATTGALADKLPQTGTNELWHALELSYYVVDSLEEFKSAAQGDAGASESDALNLLRTRQCGRSVPLADAAARARTGLPVYVQCADGYIAGAAPTARGAVLLVVLSINDHGGYDMAQVEKLMRVGYKASLSVCDIFVQTAQPSSEESIGTDSPLVTSSMLVTSGSYLDTHVRGNASVQLPLTSASVKIYQTVTTHNGKARKQLTPLLGLDGDATVVSEEDLDSAVEPPTSYVSLRT